MAPPRGQYQTKLNAVMFSMMLEELLSGPTTAQGLADYTGMHLITVQRTIRAMRRRKVLHVAGWEKDVNGRYVIRVFGLGPGHDVKAPIKTRLEMNREWRARKARAALVGFAGVDADAHRQEEVLKPHSAQNSLTATRTCEAQTCE